MAQSEQRGGAMLIRHFLEHSADKRPEKLALVCGEERLNYAQVEEQANRIAWALIEAGVERGDRVAILLENSVEAVLSIFGASKAGAAFVVINPTTKPQKLRRLLDDCAPRVLITDQQRQGQMQSVLPLTFSLLACPFPHILASGRSERPPEQGTESDLAAIIYTSGSSGRPKGVMLSHRNMVAAATSIISYLENTEDAVILDVLPLSFDYGLYQVLMGFMVGATVVLERSFAFPGAVLGTIARERVTGLPGVPTIFAILLQLKDLASHDLSSLRYLTNTGSALPVSHVRRLRELLPQVKIYLMYGLTECKRVSYLPPEQVDRRPGSVGRAMPKVEAYVVREDGSRAGPGEVGELVVSGKNVMLGYWGLPEETAEVLRPGPASGERLLMTGDLFYADEEGYLYFVGRRDDIIKSRGEKVSPKEVEEVIAQLPGVAQAVVVGVPDEVLGQAIKAVVVRANGATLTAEEVIAHCARHLEDFMVPQRVEFRAELPTTAGGKVAREQLTVDS